MEIVISSICLDCSGSGKEALEVSKQLRPLSRQTFACIPNARAMAQKLLKKSKYHHHMSG